MIRESHRATELLPKDETFLGLIDENGSPHIASLLEQARPFFTAPDFDSGRSGSAAIQARRLVAASEKKLSYHSADILGRLTTP